MTARTEDITRAPEVVAAAADRTTAVVLALRRLTDAELLAPSALEGWSRLTIACHLRYGAAALLRMTEDTLRGRPTSFYPEGRAGQREATLRPASGEAPADVVASLRATSSALDAAWRRCSPDDWAREVVEPPDRVDLGPVPLGRLALSRLVEVEVHGTDLDVGLPDWSSVLVEVALPVRLRWLTSRRSNHRDVDHSLEGAWMLVSVDGRTSRWLVSVAGGIVTSRPLDPADGADPSWAVIEGTSRDLLALLLGRASRTPLRLGGDRALAAAFGRAFPGP